DLVNQAASELEGLIQLNRVGGSYLIKVDLSSHDRSKAVKIANAVADQYIANEVDAKYQAVRHAADWLQERLQTLHTQSLAAERAVVEFKAKNNIVVAAQGKSLSDQQVDELNSQLTTARAHAADVQAKLNRIQSVIEVGQPIANDDATVSD